MRNVIDSMQDVVDLPWTMIWVFICVGATVWIIHRLVNSTYGKGIIAIRDDEIAAEIMSVNTRRMKIVAFMLSSGLAGIAGGLFAHVLGYINPGTFTIMKSTEVLVMVYLGGMGSLSGSVISAIVFTLALEAFRPLQVIKWVVVPFLLILLMVFRPEGIMGHGSKSRPAGRSLFRRLGRVRFRLLLRLALGFGGLLRGLYELPPWKEKMIEVRLSR